MRKVHTRTKAACLLVALFSAFVPFAQEVQTDVYGNEIVEVDGQQYQFWSGPKAEDASMADVSAAATAGGALDMVFKSVRATSSGSLYSTKIGLVLIVM